MYFYIYFSSTPSPIRYLQFIGEGYNPSSSSPTFQRSQKTFTTSSLSVSSTSSSPSSNPFSNLSPSFSSSLSPSHSSSLNTSSPQVHKSKEGLVKEKADNDKYESGSDPNSDKKGQKRRRDNDSNAILTTTATTTMDMGSEESGGGVGGKTGQETVLGGVNKEELKVCLFVYVAHI
jgi:hypothetical protein